MGRTTEEPWSNGGPPIMKVFVPTGTQTHEVRGRVVGSQGPFQSAAGVSGKLFLIFLGNDCQDETYLFFIADHWI